jgi:hypothetical protein
MRSCLSGLGAVVVLLCATAFAHGQKATEQFIPVGQSPGVSGKHTSIGEVAEVDARGKTVTIVEPAGKRTVKITDKTRIWLDRSKLKQAGATGGFADLKKGRRVEVKYEDPARRDVAEWVKVEVTQP